MLGGKIFILFMALEVRKYKTLSWHLLSIWWQPSWCILTCREYEMVRQGKTARNNSLLKQSHSFSAPVVLISLNSLVKVKLSPLANSPLLNMYALETSFSNKWNWRDILKPEHIDSYFLREWVWVYFVLLHPGSTSVKICWTMVSWPYSARVSYQRIS